MLSAGIASAALLRWSPVAHANLPTAVGDGTVQSRFDPRAHGLPIGLFLLALALALTFARRGPETYDSQIMLQVTQNLFDNGSFKVRFDEFGFNTPYASYGIGQSLLMLVPYALASWLGADPVSAAMDVNAFLYAGIVACAYAFARMNGADRLQCAAVAVLTGGATLLLPYTATGFSELGVALAVAVALVALQGARMERRWAPALAGAAAGAALLMRSDSLLLVVPVVAGALLAVSPRRRRALVGFGAALTPFLAAWLAYNDLRFGAPWRLGYEGPQTFNFPLFEGLEGLTVSPGRGLLWYSPFAVLAVTGLRLAWSRSRALVVFAAVLLVARLLFYSRWWAWNGGWNWGPRFLVPAMPALAVGTLALVRCWGARSKDWRAGVVAVAVASFTIQIVGAAIAYERGSLVRQGLAFAPWDGSKASVDPKTERFVADQIDRWDLFPVTDHARRLVEWRDLASKRLTAPTALVPVLALLGFLAVAAGTRGPPPRRSPPEGEASALGRSRPEPAT